MLAQTINNFLPDDPWWQGFITALIAALIPAIVTILGVFLGARYATRQLAQQHSQQRALEAERFVRAERRAAYVALLQQASAVQSITIAFASGLNVFGGADDSAKFESALDAYQAAFQAAVVVGSSEVSRAGADFQFLASQLYYASKIKALDGEANAGTEPTDFGYGSELITTVRDAYSSLVNACRDIVDTDNGPSD